MRDPVEPGDVTWLTWLSRSEFCLCYSLSLAFEWDGLINVHVPIDVAMQGIVFECEGHGYIFKGLTCGDRGELYRTTQEPIEPGNILWVMMLLDPEKPVRSSSPLLPLWQGIRAYMRANNVELARSPDYAVMFRTAREYAEQEIDLGWCLPALQEAWGEMEDRRTQHLAMMKDSLTPEQREEIVDHYRRDLERRQSADAN